MAKAFFFLAGAGALALGAAAVAQGGGGATAVYWMSADTMSGMGGMMGNGGRPSMGSVMGAMMGRGGGGAGYVRQLHLQLGGSTRPGGEPQAEHLPPATLGAGPSLPLVSPRQAPAEPATTCFPTNMERPKGRILIYWGCGEHARPGQPVVIDFASISAGKIPPAFANSAMRMMNPPSPARFATYGEWPNQRSHTSVPAGGSLVGDHVVRGHPSSFCEPRQTRGRQGRQRGESLALRGLPRLGQDPGGYLTSQQSQQFQRFQGRSGMRIETAPDRATLTEAEYDAYVEAGVWPDGAPDNVHAYDADVAASVYGDDGKVIWPAD